MTQTAAPVAGQCAIASAASGRLAEAGRPFPDWRQAFVRLVLFLLPGPWRLLQERLRHRHDQSPVLVTLDLKRLPGHRDFLAADAQGRAIVGTRAGTTLRLVPANTLAFLEWRAMPSTRATTAQVP